MFRITIQEIKTVPITRTERMLKEKRHYTDSEVEKDYQHWSGMSRDELVKEVYDSVPVEGTRETDTKVFEQTVETLDLKAVIFAVNNVPDKIVYDPLKVPKP